MNDDKTVTPESVSIEDVAPIADTPANDTTPNPEIEKLQTQLAEMNDKYLRLAAELENTRRRSALVPSPKPPEMVRICPVV